MGNVTSIVMGLGPQEEVVEEVTEVVAEEGDDSEEQQQEEQEEEEEEEGGHSEAEADVEREEEADSMLQCSICFNAVVANGRERSTARLQCGHEFHLDCIGSAFNFKGIMQCPNCRQIETGQWLHARGAVSSQHVNNVDPVSDEDLDDFSHQQVFVPLRFRWIRRSQLSELSSLFDEIEPTQEATSHNVSGQNFNAEPMDLPEPGTNHQGAYVAYMQRLSPPVSPSSTHIDEQTVDGSADHDDWNPLAGPSDGHPLHRVHPHLWAPMPDSYSPPNNNNDAAEQSGIPVGATRIEGVDSGNQPTAETGNDS